MQHTRKKRSRDFSSGALAKLPVIIGVAGMVVLVGVGILVSMEIPVQQQQVEKTLDAKDFLESKAKQ